MNNSKFKIFIFLLLAVLTFNSCQDDDAIIVEENIPTVTKEWFFQPGQERIENQAENPEILTQPIVGKNQSWDFSAATATSDDAKTISLVEPTGLPNASLFPDATIAQLSSGLGQAIYFETSEDTIKLIGAHMQEGLFGIFNQPAIVSIAPFDFGESFDFTQELSIFWGGGLFDNQKSNVEVKFAGVGTVITPSNTFEDCIMFEQTTHDLQGKLIEHSFTFYKDNLHNRVAYYAMNLNTSTDELDTRFYWSE